MAITQAFECFIDVIVKRSEPFNGIAFTGNTFFEKLEFIQKAFDFSDPVFQLLIDFWDLVNAEDTRVRDEGIHDTTLKYYFLSGLIQYLANIPAEHNLMIQHPDVFEKRYTSWETIGHSEHSRVSKAWDQEANRYVAIKTIYPIASNDSSGISGREELLLREAVILSRLNHPNIGRIYYVMLNPLRLIMEWIEGDSLERIPGQDTKELEFTEQEVVRLGLVLAEALSHAHASKIYHRDIKPSNIILRKSDKTPVLFDFDIARAQESQTITGDRDKAKYVGTPDYSAPEQWENPKIVNGKADIFSLGVVLYELINGQRPYSSNRLDSFDVHHLPEPPKLDLSNKLYSILRSMLEEVPGNRPDAEKLIELFRGIQNKNSNAKNTGIIIPAEYISKH